MNIKKVSAIVLSFVFIFSLTSCKGNDGNLPSQTDGTTENAGVLITENISATESTFAVSSVTSAPDIKEEETEPGSTSENISDNPAEWSTEQIIEAYKNAAKKSAATAKSEQFITLRSISVNNGEHQGLFEFITPIMSKLLSNNSKESDGITGGYNNLTASDAHSARAYKSGNNIAVEMVMKNQTSGACDDPQGGSVGHAINAVGDLSVVTKQLKDLGLPLDIPQESTKIYYTDATVRVLINSNGEIVNGTWKYTVDINLNDYKAFGKAVDTTSVIMDNTITVNGGFSK